MSKQFSACMNSEEATANVLGRIFRGEWPGDADQEWLDFAGTFESKTQPGFFRASNYQTTGSGIGVDEELKAEIPEFSGNEKTFVSLFFTDGSYKVSLVRILDSGKGAIGLSYLASKTTSPKWVYATTAGLNLFDCVSANIGGTRVKKFWPIGKITWSQLEALKVQLAELGYNFDEALEGYDDMDEDDSRASLAQAINQAGGSTIE